MLSSIATVNSPWAIAFLPARRVLVVTPTREKMPIEPVSAIAAEGQNRLLDVGLSSRNIDHEVTLRRRISKPRLMSMTSIPSATFSVWTPIAPHAGSGGRRFKSVWR